MLDKNILDLLNSNIVKLILCALIVYLSFMDVITAVLLTIAFVLTLHQSTKKAYNNNIIKDVVVNDTNEKDNNIINRINNLNNVKVENYEDLNKALKNNADNDITDSESVENIQIESDSDVNQDNTNESGNNNSSEEKLNNQFKNNTLEESLNRIPKGIDDSPDTKYADIEWKSTHTEKNNNENLVGEDE